ncbi:MAG: GGDEF domain-containing protein [Ruminococcus sp.]|nr:GGDEF domain-containing protein [Ruminococcus sp.]MBR1752360.1 GGDEF domain-containing protein [Ruminococcus sp.]
MKAKDRTRPSLSKINHLQLFMIIGYAAIVILSIVVVTQLAVRKTDSVLKNKVTSMTSSLGVQMKLNLDSYISRMETIATLAFGEPSSYTYDATDPDNDEYEALGTEKLISDKLYSLCIMENFVDYGIVYRNNRTVGKISNATSSLFGENIYTELESMISRTRTSDGWATGYENDFKRIYYVKRVHDNAVLVISFYANELDAVFDNPETMSDMEVSLVNQDYNILYSKRGMPVGDKLHPDIISKIEGQGSATVMDDDFLISVNTCGDWFVVCSIPTEVILSEKNDMRFYIYLVGGFATIAAILISWAFSFMITKPVKQTVSTLDTKARIDQLTGIFNKKSFEEFAAERLSPLSGGTPCAMIILDIDDFKSVNDTLGHAFGDIVLAKTGSILRTTFSDEDYVGRIGGDEFCVLVNFVDEGRSLREQVAAKCEEICGAFSNNYTGKNNDYKVSASIGAALFPNDGRDYEQLFAACDKAMYRSKKTGKDTYTFFDILDESEG